MQENAPAWVQLAELGLPPRFDAAELMTTLSEDPDHRGLAETLPPAAPRASPASMAEDAQSKQAGARAPHWTTAPLSAAIMHELSSPLAAAKNYMNAARHALERSGPDATSLACEYLRLASTQMAHAGTILRQAWDLMDLSEARGRVRHLGSIVEEAVALAALGPLDPALHLQTEIAPEAQFTPLDHAGLGQVVARLIQAAALTLRSQTSPEILVSAAAQLSQHQVTVTIQGSALPAQDDAGCGHLSAPADQGEFRRTIAACKANLAARGGRITVTPAGTSIAVLMVVPIIPLAANRL